MRSSRSDTVDWRRLICPTTEAELKVSRRLGGLSKCIAHIAGDVHSQRIDHGLSNSDEIVLTLMYKDIQGLS